MIENATAVGVGGILALLVIREVFRFVVKLREGTLAPAGANGKTRPKTDPIRAVQTNVEAVLIRLDRIVDRLDELSEETKLGRKQSEIAGEQTERMVRAVSQLEHTINEATQRRRSHETNPGL